MSRSRLLMETLEVWRGSGSRERFGDLEFGSLIAGRQRLVLVFRYSSFHSVFSLCCICGPFSSVFGVYISVFISHS